jgi:predicted outer membrane protein
LSKLQGAEFDREYVTAMVHGHEEVPTPADRPAGAAAVGTTGTPATEQAVTQWATKTLPTVQQHLERARDLQKKVAK